MRRWSDKSGVFSWFGLYVCCSLVLLAIDSLTRLESIEWLLHVVLVWLVAELCDSRYFVWAGALSSVCIMLGAVLSPESPLPSWVLLINRAISIGGIWTIVYFSLQRRMAERAERQSRAELEQSLSEIRVLRGILPICAHCKRIRTDTGAWQQMEAYIRDHTEAEFSHGICDDCGRQYYAEFWRKEPHS